MDVYCCSMAEVSVVMWRTSILSRLVFIVYMKRGCIWVYRNREWTYGCFRGWVEEHHGCDHDVRRRHTDGEKRAGMHTYILFSFRRSRFSIYTKSYIHTHKVSGLSTSYVVEKESKFTSEYVYVCMLVVGESTRASSHTIEDFMIIRSKSISNRLLSIWCMIGAVFS